MFVEKERGAIMQELLTIIAVVIVAAIFVAIGISIMAQTTVQTSDSLTDVNTVDPTYYKALIASNQNAAQLVQNTTSYSNILVLAVIGGLALAAILAYMWLFGGMGGAGGQRMQAAY
jgi:ABC-type maltose transport system permease subunit